MIIAFTYHDGDAHLALETAKLIKELGGNKQHKCFLISPRNTRHSEDIKRILFGEFELLAEYDIQHELTGWPIAPNQNFFECCVLFKTLNEPWMFFEADCCPLKRGWLDDLQKEYVKQTRAGFSIMGHKHEDAFMPNGTQVVWRHTTGAAVYPPDMFNYVDAKGRPRKSVLYNLPEIRRAQGWIPPFDRYLNQERWVSSANTPLIRSMPKIGNYVVENGKIVGQYMTEEASWHHITPSTTVPETAVVLHGCKDTSIHQAVRDKLFPKPKTVFVPTVFVTNSAVNSATEISDAPNSDHLFASGWVPEREGPLEEATVSEKPKKKDKWEGVDWSMSNSEIAKSMGLHYMKVVHERKRRGL